MDPERVRCLPMSADPFTGSSRMRAAAGVAPRSRRVSTHAQLLRGARGSRRGSTSRLISSIRCRRRPPRDPLPRSRQVTRRHLRGHRSQQPRVDWRDTLHGQLWAPRMGQGRRGRAAHRARQGHVHVSGREQRICTGTFFIPGGSVVGEGYIRFSNAPFTIPVVGGTGAYAGARGTFTSRSIRDNGEVSLSADVIRLLP